MLCMYCTCRHIVQSIRIVIVIHAATVKEKKEKTSPSLLSLRSGCVARLLSTCSGKPNPDFYWIANFLWI